MISYKIYYAVAFSTLIACAMSSISHALDVSPNEGIVLQKGQVLIISATDSNVSNTPEYFSDSRTDLEYSNDSRTSRKKGSGNVYLRLKSLYYDGEFKNRCR